MNGVKIQDVRSFWENNPLCAASIPFPPGSRDFFEYYDHLREANESPEFSYWLHEYKRFSGKRVLDVGSGNGYILSKYALEGAEAYGIDLTQTAIDLCRRRFEILGIQGNFQIADAEDLPFESDSFDCVCSMGVLHHVPNTESAVDEIFRVLKPGGRLIVMFYHRDSLLYRFTFPWVRLITRKTLQQLVNEVDGASNPKGDVYSKAELLRMLGHFEQLEFFIGLLQGWMLVPKIGRVIPGILLQPFEKRWGWFLYARAYKPAVD